MLFVSHNSLKEPTNQQKELKSVNKNHNLSKAGFHSQQRKNEIDNKRNDITEPDVADPVVEAGGMAHRPGYGPTQEAYASTCVM